MNEKLCIFCKHFDWDRVGYQCGDSYDDIWGGATCKRGHYSEWRPDNTEEMRGLFLRAEKCKDYERP